MDKGGMKEPAASSPVWAQLEEWTRGRIQEWMQAVAGRGDDRIPGARQASTP